MAESEFIADLVGKVSFISTEEAAKRLHLSDSLIEWLAEYPPIEDQGPEILSLSEMIKLYGENSAHIYNTNLFKNRRRKR